MGNSGFSLLTLALVTLAAAAQEKCALSGTWTSSRGCRMLIFELKDGAFSGLYLPQKAMVPHNDVLASPLRGAQHDTSYKTQPSFGFTVHWHFRESPAGATTAFVGQCFVDSDGEETLRTAWLLREEAAAAREDWKATRVGTNVFTRVK
ncbi:avidin-like [Alligator mississippiensis]|uniref:Avidin-like n=1 Tax=Alligator mississippiensis TaxID=8496 RepID=A0A151MRD5_ALLMI|nr:avidin-like [Alligator mississippiensis]